MRPGLVDEHKADLFRFCCYLTNKPDVAEELFQQTWLRTIDRISTYKPHRSFRAWLNAIAANLYKDQHRRQARQAKYQSSVDPELLQRWEPTTEQRLETELDIERLKQAVQQLDDIYRIPLLLYYDQELSYRDIAAALEIPAGTVKSRLNYARRQLKDMMDGGDSGDG